MENDVTFSPPSGHTVPALAALEELQKGIDAVREKIFSLEDENEILRRRLDDAHTHNSALSARIEELEATCARSEAQIEADRQQNNKLEEHIRELYSDLNSENLPTLALKMAMRLTGAEVGLFAEADGDDALAQIGFDDLQEFLINAIWDFSRRASREEAPVVENDAQKLPDGAGLVNLAALPFAVKGELRGVLLLANKRNGPFTDDECRILLTIGQHAGLAIENARLHHQLGESYASTVAVLADAIEAKDAYTRGHCEGVSRVAVEVGRRLGLDSKTLENVRYAALLHDVGKIGIPDGILLKPGRLIEEEFSIIQKHSAIGRDLISRVPALSHIGEAILHHHEKFDGSGYPDGLAGEGIPLLARIIGAVDAFDAMTSPRPYRDAIAVVEAFEEMQRCSGSHFDPQIVEIVTSVLLQTGDEAPALPVQSSP